MYLVVFFLILLLFYWKRKIVLLSVVDAFMFFFGGVIIFTFLYHNYYPNHDKFNFFELDFLTKKRFDETFYIFIKLIILFLFGVILYGIFNKSYLNLSRQKIKIFNSKNLVFNSDKISKIVLTLTIVCIILVWIDYGSLLFYRIKYIPKESSIYKIIYQNLLIVSCLLSGVIYRKKKGIAILAFLVAMTIGIGIGSRAATIYLIVFGFSYAFFLESNKAKIFYFIYIPFVVVFFGYNIALRLEATGHGLIPYFKVTFNKPEIIFKYLIMNIYYTFVFGFYATAETFKLYKNPSISNLVTVLSPLPGRMTDWYVIASRLRINAIAPFTAIGEMAKYPIFNCFYYIFIGYYFSFIDNFIKLQLLSKKYLWAILHFILLVLFIVHSFEYNLRSTNRFIYYSMAVYVIYFILKNIKSKLPKNDLNNTLQ
jgi:hypothetical protein